MGLVKTAVRAVVGLFIGQFEKLIAADIEFGDRVLPLPVDLLGGLGSVGGGPWVRDGRGWRCGSGGSSGLGGNEGGRRKEGCQQQEYQVALHWIHPRAVGD